MMDIDDYGPLLTAEAFLEIDFGERIKAELQNGSINPLRRGPAKRVRVADNLLCLIAIAIRGTGPIAYGSSLALRSGARSVRFPDVAVYRRGQEPVASCGDRDLMANPVLVAHVRPLDVSQAAQLLDEYQSLPSVQAILLVDHEMETVRLLQRTAFDGWLDERTGAGELVIPSLDLTIPHAEIFARD